MEKKFFQISDWFKSGLESLPYGTGAVLKQVQKRLYKALEVSVSLSVT